MSILTPFFRCLAIGVATLWTAAATALAASGDVDTTFSQWEARVTHCIALQPDGRAVVAQPSTGISMSLLRLNENGQRDLAFSATTNAAIRCMVAQPDGKILIGGNFNMVSGVPRRFIARLLEDGSVDPTFNPGSDGWVAAISVMPGGDILFSGWFGKVAGQTRYNIAKVSSTGELLPFAPFVSGQCLAMHVQADGNILIGGDFSRFVNLDLKYNVARLSAEGVYDDTFAPSSNHLITWISEQPGGKVLMMNSLSPDTPEHSRFMRVDAVTGAEDTTLKTGLASFASIHAIYMQTDGKVVIAGKFQSSGGGSYQLARLGANGLFDITFSSVGAGLNPIRAIAPLPDGRMLVGGEFTKIRSTNVTGLARLQGDAVSTPLVAPDASTVEWQRAANAPAFARVTFESRTGNGPWTFLGHGQRINDNWRLEGTTLPANGVVRARGFMHGTPHGSIHTAYLSLGNTQPQITIEHAGTVVPPGGTLPLGDALVDFQWFRDLKVTNTGDHKLEQLAISSSTNVGNPSPLPTSLQPGESAMIRIGGLPTEVQTLSGSITIASNAPNATTYPVNVSGKSTMVFSPVFNSPTDVPVPGGGSLFNDQTFGTLTLGFAPQPGTVLTAIKGITDYNAMPNLQDGTIVTADYQGVTYRFVAGQTNSSNTPLDLTFTLLGGDGTYEEKYTSSFGTPLEMEDDGAFRYENYRNDAAGVFDPVFSSSIYFGNEPKALSLINGEMIRATGSNVSPPKLVKTRNDGRQDPTFNPTINGAVLAMAAQPDDRILIGGSFTEVSGQPRISLARLHLDGSLDTTFTSQLDLTGASVKSIAVQPDGKILVATTAAMTLPGGGSSKVARFLPDGTVDTSFSLATEHVDRLLVLPDGKILKTSSTTYPYESLRRYLPDGSLDAGFFVPLSSSIRDVALLADGKLLIYGQFYMIGVQHFPGFARLHPDGTVDPTFIGKTLSSPTHALVNSKNQLIIGGTFGSANGVKATLARLNNPTAVTSAAQVNANTIRWTRQGAAAELNWVKAELIPQGGGTPVSLGLAQRVSGGWEVTSPTALTNGTVRLYGPATHSAGMTVMVKELVPVGIVTPQLELTWDDQPAVDGVPKDFGTLTMGQSVNAFLRMKNVGAGTANAPLVTIEGPHAADYTLTQASPTALGTGEQRSFLLKIYPIDGGPRSAQLVIRTPERTQPLLVIPLGFQTTNNVINPVFNSASDIPVTGVSFDASVMRLGTFTLNFAPAPDTILTLVSNSTGALTGSFKDLPLPGIISAEYNGVTYHFGANYTGGSGNDLTLKLLGNGDILPEFRGGADGKVNGIAIQPDGKAIVSGNFNHIGGTPRSGIARLHPNGEVDTSFNASQAGFVENITVLDDDRILTMGTGTVNGVPNTALACFNPDGSLSEDFRLVFGFTETASAQVVRLLKLRNGKFLVGGRFTSVNGDPRTNLARLNADGTLDPTFTTVIAGQSPNAGYVYSLAEQADGRLLIGGSFGSVNGTTRYCFARLHADGSLDQDFNPVFAPNTTNTFNDPYGTRVSTVIELPDGKILLGGKFSSISGTSRSGFARLNADGTVDTTLNLGANDVVTSLSLQADGKVLAGGLFTIFGGQVRSRIARIRADDTLDPDFAPSSNSTVSNMTLDREGNLWITGSFSNMNGVTVTGIAKLRNDSGSTALTIGPDNASWALNGTAPALREVKFELSTDGGAVWSPLGNATKVASGWSIEGLSLPPHGYLRAKGIAIGGNRGFSAVEDVVLFGRQPTKIEQWRMEQFGSFTNQRTGADLADADNDGVKNLMEYAFNLDPQDATSAQVPAWTNDNSQFEINFTPPANVEGVSYGVEWSSTMNPSDWHDVSNQGTGGNHHYVVPKDATPLKFMRVKVTNTGLLPPP